MLSFKVKSYRLLLWGIFTKILCVQSTLSNGSEQAHDRGRQVLIATSRVPGLCTFLRAFNQVKEDKPVKLFGLEFPNRVGLAAGMDKDGEFVRAIEALGFGHAEVGTVTPKAQPGNPRPRLFRYPERNALINRMGFNNHGADAMLKCLTKNYPKGKAHASRSEYRRS